MSIAIDLSRKVALITGASQGIAAQISQTFHAAGAAVVVNHPDLGATRRDGKLCIVREGTHAKFVESVRQVCFGGPSAFARGQQAMFVTKNAVFVLTAHGLALTEVAPGIDLQRQVLDQMEFGPVVFASGSSTGRYQDAVGEGAAIPWEGLARCLDPTSECRAADG